MNDDKINEFNQSQKEAILSPSNQNVLISAGAGSGKTKTLSYKVYKLIKNKEIKTSELLVLTFTNKSAFDMKKKIIEQFTSSNLEEDKSLAIKIVSSHIQTFDSFSLYLVKKYCSYLNISENIKIADDNILNTKKSELLDEILHYYYVNQKERIISSFSKFCFKDDNIIKSLIFYIDSKLNMFLPSKRREYISNYEKNFLSKDFFDKELYSYVSSIKQEMYDYLRTCFFNYNAYSFKDDSNLMASAIDNDNYYNINKYTTFNDIGSEKLKNHFFSLLETDYKEFFTKVDLLINSQETQDDFNGSKNRSKKETKIEHECIYKPLNEYIKSTLYEKILIIGKDYNETYNQLISFKDDIKLIFEIIEKLNEELYKYKVQTSSFTFSDIGYMALSLLTEDKYKNCSDEIKNTYKYVLVDEYQDTNDIQETFLECISQKATLFCVGDAKQSIYRFRNSNVQLFLNRKEAYENKTKEGKVINMNWNYRSSFELLDNINSIFDCYMSKNHGGLDYFEEKIENNKVIYPQKLCHDDNPNFIKYKESLKDKNSFYGLGLIQFTNNDYKKDEELEIKIIIQDIKNKISSHYKVNDEGKLRDCKYSDFAILLRSKNGFDKYQNIFNEYDIPLNIMTEDHLTQINAILLLQSLINLISLTISKIKGEEIEEENIKLLFMSIARSYIYGKEKGYDDNKIHHIIKENKIYDDEIIIKCKNFAIAHKDSSLQIIFFDILKEFEILDKLDQVGDISSNVDKIESFFKMVTAQQDIGQGIDDFVKLFKNISKYKIDLKNENTFEIDNAVNLMTTHKSKGLEFPIVYLPLHNNKFSNRSTSLTDPIFSLKEGILLPNYVIDKNSITFLHDKYYKEEGSKKEEINEYVRIIYVALTRAKESLFIVANVDSEHAIDKNSKETLYDMLKSVYHYPVVSSKVIELILKLKLVDKSKFDEINEMIVKLHSLYTLDFKNSSLKNNVLSNYIDDYLKNIQEKIDELKEKLLIHYLTNCNEIPSIDKKRIYSMYKFNDFTLHDDKEYNLLHPILDKIDSLYSSLINKKLKDILNSKKKVLDEKLLSCFLYVINSIEEPFDKLNFDDKVIKTFHLDLEDDKKIEIKKYKNIDVEINDDEIKFDEIKYSLRASKTFNKDEDLEMMNNMEYGTLLHSYLEHSDLINKKIPNIENKKDKTIILKAIDELNKLDLTDTIVRTEYDYFDDEANTTGKIDLLLIHKKRNEISIIDYKTKNIEDDGYDRQLNIYRKNISKLFKNYKVKMYLFSIIDCNLKEVKEKEY